MEQNRHGESRQDAVRAKKRTKADGIPIGLQVTANDIYSTSLAWFAPGRSTADVQISSICPATEKVSSSASLSSMSLRTDRRGLDRQHIKKYSVQVSRLVRETPAVYEQVVKPYIESIPPSAISWVYNILDGTAEAENVLYRDDDPEQGFVLTPDL